MHYLVVLRFQWISWAVSSWSLQFLECLCRQSERACEALHARSSLPPPSIMQQYINIIITTTTIMIDHDECFLHLGVFTPTEKVPTGSCVLCSTSWLCQQSLISSNDLKSLKKLISGKENKSGCLFSMILIVIRDISLYIEVCLRYYHHSRFVMIHHLELMWPWPWLLPWAGHWFRRGRADHAPTPLMGFGATDWRPRP